MNHFELNLSNHARRQASRRNFSMDDIYFVVKNGKPERKTGAVFFQMREKDMPDNIPPNDRRHNLIGATVLTCKCKKFVITMYKNPGAFKKDSRKSKYTTRDGLPTQCPCCQRHH